MYINVIADQYGRFISKVTLSDDIMSDMHAGQQASREYANGAERHLHRMHDKMMTAVNEPIAATRPLSLVTKTGDTLSMSVALSLSDRGAIAVATRRLNRACEKIGNEKTSVLLVCDAGLRYRVH